MSAVQRAERIPTEGVRKILRSEDTSIQPNRLAALLGRESLGAPHDTLAMAGSCPLVARRVSQPGHPVIG